MRDLTVLDEVYIFDGSIVHVQDQRIVKRKMKLRKVEDKGPDEEDLNLFVRKDFHDSKSMRESFLSTQSNQGSDSLEEVSLTNSPLE